MSTLRTHSPAVKSHKPVARHCRISAAVNGFYALDLTVGKSRTGYYVESVPSDFGRCLKLTKFDTTPGTDKEATSYDMCLDGIGSDCSCKGYGRHGHCKHVQALKALVAKGSCDPHNHGAAAQPPRSRWSEHPMNSLCACCGALLESYEVGSYCPDCTYYDALELAQEADEEARVLRQQPEPAWIDGPDDDGPPF